LALSKIYRNTLKEQRFTDIADIQRNVATLLPDIPEKGFQYYFRQ
jgi:hypothetical protein